MDRQILVLDNFATVLAVCPNVATASKMTHKSKQEIKLYCDRHLTGEIYFRYLDEWSEIVPIDLQRFAKVAYSNY